MGCYDENRMAAGRTAGQSQKFSIYFLDRNCDILSGTRALSATFFPTLFKTCYSHIYWAHPVFAPGTSIPIGPPHGNPIDHALIAILPPKTPHSANKVRHCDIGYCLFRLLRKDKKIESKGFRNLDLVQDIPLALPLSNKMNLHNFESLTLMIPDLSLHFIVTDQLIYQRWNLSGHKQRLLR